MDKYTVVHGTVRKDLNLVVDQPWLQMMMWCVYVGRIQEELLLLQSTHSPQCHALIPSRQAVSTGRRRQPHATFYSQSPQSIRQKRPPLISPLKLSVSPAVLLYVQMQTTSLLYLTAGRSQVFFFRFVVLWGATRHIKHLVVFFVFSGNWTFSENCSKGNDLVACCEECQGKERTINNGSRSSRGCKRFITKIWRLRKSRRMRKLLTGCGSLWIGIVVVKLVQISYEEPK